MGKHWVKIMALAILSLPTLSHAQVEKMGYFINDEGAPVMAVKMVENDTLMAGARWVEFSGNRFRVLSGDGTELVSLKYKARVRRVKLPVGKRRGVSDGDKNRENAKGEGTCF